MDHSRDNRFTITEDHIKLLQRAYVSWEHCEFGAPSIDCKRPYGNSSVYEDIGEILGIEPEDGEEFSDDEQDKMFNIHKGTKTALQIFLRLGRMEPGTYSAPVYTDDWVRVDE